MAKKNMWTPSDDDLMNAQRDIAWEFTAMLAAALEMAKGPCGPTNHQSQEDFLLHVRNLAEFFREKVKDFEDALKKVPPPPFPKLERELLRGDNIYAVDFCREVLWAPGDFSSDRQLLRAINKTLSHMSYSRSAGVVPFDGKYHVHGTVALMCRTWDGYLRALRPEFHMPLLRGLREHTRADDPWGLRPLTGYGNRFEMLVNYNGWRLNETPDGPSPFPYPPDFPYWAG